MHSLRKSFIAITIIILSTFFVTVLIAMNNFNSQIKYTNERNIVTKQIYYNAYAGLQRGIFEIRMDRKCSMADYFSLTDNQPNVSPQNQKYYTYFKVTNVASGTKYQYTIESIGYGKFKESLLQQKITAKITVDYVEKTGIIRIDSIEVQ